MKKDRRRWIHRDDSGCIDHDYYERESEFAQMRLNRQLKLEKLQKVSELAQKFADNSETAIRTILDEANIKLTELPPSSQTSS